MAIQISVYDKFKPITNARYKGNFGSCYIFDDKVIKIFNGDERIKKCNVEENLREIIDKNIKVNGVSLPIDLVYQENEFCGYTMPYFKGITLGILLEKIKRGKITMEDSELYNLYYSLVLKTNELSKQKIRVNDVKPDNIIVYNNELCLVDCDFYKIDNRENLDEYNLSLLNDCFKKIGALNVIYKDENAPIKRM